MEYAAQGNQCSAEHWTWLLEQPNSGIVPFSQIDVRTPKFSGFFFFFFFLMLFPQAANFGAQWSDLVAKLGKSAFISFDIDSIQSSDCPGVSAPANFGLTATQATQMCLLAGQAPNVRLFDLSEFNPLIEDYRTARLVVVMLYFFAMGVVKRKQNAGQ